MADAISQAIAALSTGQSLDSVSTSGSAAPAADSAPTEGTESTEVSQPDVDIDRMLGDEPAESATESEPQEKSKAKVEDDRYEVVEINGKKYRVDTQDKEQVRKAVRMAARMQKFQSEKDRLAAKLEARDKEFSELKGVLDRLEQYRDDPKAMVKIFSGGKMDFDQVIKSEMEKARIREEATPEERAQMDLQEKLTHTENERKRLEKMLNDHLTEAKTAKAEAQLNSYKAKLEPAFEKLRYAGKLGDPVAEESIDRTLWRETISRLEEYPETVEMTQEMVNKEFKAVRAVLDKIVKIQADERVKKVSAERKAKAKETAQIQATRGNEHTSVEKEFAQKVRGNDLTSILKNPAKYLSILGKN